MVAAISKVRCRRLFVVVLALITAVLLVVYYLRYNPVISNNACLSRLNHESKCGLLTVADGLRLGNQMCAYASLLSISKKTNKVAFLPNNILPNLWDAFDRLSLPVCDLPLDGVRQGFESIRPGAGSKFHQKLFKLACGTNVVLENLLNSYKYNTEFEADIRNEFVFKNSVLKECQDVIREAARIRSVPASCIFVGIHLRRNDVAPRSIHGQLPADIRYVHRAMEQMRKIVQQSCVLFVALGDDNKWNVENFAHLPDVYVPPMRSAAVDLCVLSQCNHTIMTTGTFGSWGGRLAGGTVIYQKTFAVEGSLVDQEVFADDVFPRPWIGL